MTKTTAQEKIKQAFIELVLEKGFEKTSVSGIIKHAGIHRSTFYAYYEDKYQLLDQLQEEVIFGMHHHFLNGQEVVRLDQRDIRIERQQYLSLLRFIREEGQLVLALYTDSLRQPFMLRFLNELNDIFLEAYNHYQIQIGDFSRTEEDYCDAIYIQGIFIIFQKWIEGQFEDDIEMITDLLIRLEQIYP